MWTRMTIFKETVPLRCFNSNGFNISGPQTPSENVILSKGALLGNECTIYILIANTWLLCKGQALSLALYTNPLI